MCSLSEDDIHDMKVSFLVFDRKGDDKIDASNAGDLLRSLGLNCSNAVVKKFVGEHWDKPNKQRLTFEEFLPIYEQVYKEKDSFGTYADFMEGLKVYDKESNGTVIAAELAHVLCTLGERLTDEEVEQIMKGFEDSDGNVQYEKWITHVMNPPKES